MFKKSVKKIIIGISLVLLIGWGMMFYAWASDSEDMLRPLIDTFNLIKSHYVKEVNSSELVYGAIKGMLKTLDDEFSYFLDPESLKDSKESLGQSFEGIGIYIGIRNDRLTVISPIEGTPAYRAGLKSGDWIAEINGEPTDDMNLDQAISKIKGPRGTKVTLGIRRGLSLEIKEVVIVRDKIDVPSVEEKMIADNIGYIKMRLFGSKTSRELEQAIQELEAEGMEGLILDLRNNGGGYLEAAIHVGNIFLSDKPIVYIQERNGVSSPIYATKKADPDDYYLLVLVNEYSASASEIVAGAIKDNKRGILMGTTTFGKGEVQTILSLSDGSAVALTTAMYLTPAGNNIHKEGIEPDIVSKSSDYFFAAQGIGEPGSKVEIIVDGESKGVATIDEEGTFVLQDEIPFEPQEELEKKDSQLQDAIKWMQAKIEEGSLKVAKEEDK